MSKRQILMILGVWVMILPSAMLGLPGWLKTVLGVVTGLAIVIISYRVKAAGDSRPVEPVADSYVESRTEPVPRTDITSPDQKMTS